jgi:hypothetical protein
MKVFILIVLTIFITNANAQSDYTFQVNDSSFDIALDKSYVILVNGQKVNLKLAQKEELTYNTDLYSFLYPKAFKVSTTKVDDGIEQLSILTAEGSGLLIQKYNTINPTSLNELMLTEMTKESISYGYVAKKTNYTKTLKSGQEINIIKSELRYKDEVNVYEIASIGKKDEGILIVTIRLDENANTQGQKIIDLMWKSLQFK